MKKTLILQLILISFSGFINSQTIPKFNLTKDGASPVVLTFDANQTADVLYTKIKAWAATNPNIKIRVDTKTSIKVGIHKDKAWKIIDKNFENWYDLKYTLTIDIKDAKCRISFETPEVKYKVWYNKDGSTIKKFKDSETSFEATINEPLTKLYKYITEQKAVKKDDW